MPDKRELLGHDADLQHGDEDVRGVHERCGVRGRGCDAAGMLGDRRVRAVHR